MDYQRAKMAEWSKRQEADEQALIDAESPAERQARETHEAAYAEPLAEYGTAENKAQRKRIMDTFKEYLRLRRERIGG